MIADVITVSRIVFSLILLGLPPSSCGFAALYLLCGVSDMLDGFAARKLHTESKRGALLDSAADMVFAAVYAVKILPCLNIPLWIWLWTAGIAAIKLAGIIRSSRRERRLSVRHSFANRLTGLLIFLLPLSAYFADVKYGAALVCAAATFAAVGEIRGG